MTMSDRVLPEDEAVRFLVSELGGEVGESEPHQQCRWCHRHPAQPESLLCEACSGGTQIEEIGLPEWHVLTDAEIMAMGYRPTRRGWLPLENDKAPG
jgi:hypothetical protein